MTTIDPRAAARVAIVTGSAAGIGLAIVERLAAHGWHVAITDRDGAMAERQAARLRTTGAHAIARRLDVTSEAEVDSVVPAIASELGRLDLFVNNAGITIHGPIAELPFASWRKVLDVDLDGVFLGTRAAGRIMVPAGRGSIVNIASIAWDRGSPGRAPYVVSKAGVVGLTKVAAVEWAAAGVRVNAVAPGYIDTALLQDAYRAGALAEEDVLARIPAGRVAHASEIAAVVAFLASDDASYVTGQVITVDGGFLADYGVGLRKA